MAETDAPPQTGDSRLSDFLCDEREQILRAWERRVREEPDAAPLTAPVLRDHVPALLDLIAELVGRGAPPGGVGALEHLPEIHARERLAIGFDLNTVVKELGALRSTVFGLYKVHAAGRDGRTVIEELETFDEAINDVTLRSVSTYAHARERTLVALDRVSAAALGTDDLDGFLQRLLQVVLETTATADYVTVFLKDGEVLTIRAAAGPGSAEAQGFRVRIGEGFAGSIAARKQDVLLRSAATDAAIMNPALKRLQIRALYGVPLIHGEEVVGVAELGSRSAFDFSEDDKQLFRAMAQRATALIVQTQLIERLRVSEEKLERLLESERAARIEAEETLAVLNTFASSTPLGFAFIDRERRYGIVNNALSKMHGVPREKHLGKTVGELFPGPVADFVEPLLKRVLDTGVPELHLEIEVPCIDEPGPNCWREVSYYPVRTSAGEIIGVGVIAADISARKREQQQTTRRADFAQELMAIVSHDLRSPISAILISAATLLRREGLDERQRTTLRRMVSSAQRANRMIGDLLDFTRAQVGSGIAIERETLDFDVAVQHAVDEICLARPDAKVTLLRQGAGTGAWDADRLAQIVTNLVTNALQHGTGEGPVQIVTRAEGDAAVLSVKNSGVIPETELPELFDAYRRGTRSRDRGPSGGVGLGLYITRLLVEAHGGHIDVASNDETGTTFTVTLPRHISQP